MQKKTYPKRVTTVTRMEMSPIPTLSGQFMCCSSLSRWIGFKKWLENKTGKPAIESHQKLGGGLTAKKATRSGLILAKL